MDHIKRAERKSLRHSEAKKQGSVAESSELRYMNRKYCLEYIYIFFFVRSLCAMKPDIRPNW